VKMQYDRKNFDLERKSFRVRGDIIEVMPAYEVDIAFRIEFFGDELERISRIDPLTGRVQETQNKLTIFPGSHHVTPEDVQVRAIQTIRAELADRAASFEAENKFVEHQRILQRTKYDLEMIKEIGFCKGIENYSRHFSMRGPGDPPPCLLDYFPEDFIIFIDESHQTLPQVRAMYNGDRARKEALVEFGFRLPSAYDNRPLKFEEFYERIGQVIYVSATPGPFEMEQTGGEIVQQIIRPTGLVDPVIEIRPATNQVDDSLEEIRRVTKQGYRVLVTTLTKKLAEDLSRYLEEIGVKAKYLHSDIDTLERVQIIKELRKGQFDVLVGINLLREGLDIPEVALVAILDADKEGFLRSETALVQTCGRAARNVYGRVIMYADKMTGSIERAMQITSSRRTIQQNYNQKHGITPQTIKREVTEDLMETFTGVSSDKPRPETERLTAKQVSLKIKEYEKYMRLAAKELRFEDAARFRDELEYFKELELLEDIK
ncbi:MAG TPA: helicase-related protein, partial [Chlamydiales bacterium]|nr:helicase-related protein [Chlamydiales bacterium]